MGNALLAGQTVVVVGGSSGIGLETARQARREGASVVITGRDGARLGQAGRDVDAIATAAFDVSDEDALTSFFEALPTPIDHVMVTAGALHYVPLLHLERPAILEALGTSVATYLAVTRCATPKMTARGSLIFMGGTGGRRIGKGVGIHAVTTAELPPSSDP